MYFWNIQGTGTTSSNMVGKKTSVLHTSFFSKSRRKPQIHPEDPERKLGFSWGLLWYWFGSGQYINLLVFVCDTLVFINYL